MPDQWSAPWTRRLWKAWLGVVGTLVALALGLFGIFERTTLSEGAWHALSTAYAWPLGVVVLAILATALAVSAAFITVVQVADRRRLKEASAKLDAQSREIAGLTAERDQHAAELRAKRRDLENLQSMFREQQRLRMTDHITGIPNYQSWEDDLRNWAALRSEEKQFSLILLDIDQLRWLNQRSRACADDVLRFFARNTYDSMRRDDQVYKVAERAERDERSAKTDARPEMYRHYQGGDEFFFFITGDVYAAVGFVNRLAERLVEWTPVVREKILRTHHLSDDDIATFRLAFSASIAPLVPGTEPDTALANAYAVLGRAKESAHSRLLVVFDTAYEAPAARRAELERDLERVRARVARHAASPPAPPHLGEEERRLTVPINLLKNAERLFPPRASS